MHNEVEKIERMRNERGWATHKLATESGVSDATIRKWVSDKRMPSIECLKQICSAFGITIADFFAENKMVELTPDKQELFDKWSGLSKAERLAVMGVIDSYASKKG